jgi:hypothetical protein
MKTQIEGINIELRNYCKVKNFDLWCDKVEQYNQTTTERLDTLEEDIKETGSQSLQAIKYASKDLEKRMEKRMEQRLSNIPGYRPETVTEKLGG